MDIDGGGAGVGLNAQEQGMGGLDQGLVDMVELGYGVVGTNIFLQGFNETKRHQEELKKSLDGR